MAGYSVKPPTLPNGQPNAEAILSKSTRDVKVSSSDEIVPGPWDKTRQHDYFIKVLRANSGLPLEVFSKPVFEMVMVIPSCQETASHSGGLPAIATANRYETRYQSSLGNGDRLVLWRDLQLL